MFLAARFRRTGNVKPQPNVREYFASSFLVAHRVISAARRFIQCGIMFRARGFDHQFRVRSSTKNPVDRSTEKRIRVVQSSCRILVGVIWLPCRTGKEHLLVPELGESVRSADSELGSDPRALKGLSGIIHRRYILNAIKIESWHRG